jgi:hypothetical protein
MSDADTTEDDANLDDLFGSLGLDNKPVSQEELFINEHLTQLKIDTIRFCLVGEMARFHHMVAKGCVPCKKILSEGSRVPTFRPVTLLEYGEVSVDYYLDMKHLAWFQDISNRKALNKAAILSRIMAIESVRKTIETAR